MILALKILQTCTFYTATNRGEMRAEVNTVSKLYTISVIRAKTQKTVTDFLLPIRKRNKNGCKLDFHLRSLTSLLGLSICAQKLGVA